MVLANDSRVLQSGLHTARIGMDLHVLLADVLFNNCQKENGLLKSKVYFSSFDSFLDCIRFAKGKVLSKSVNGKVEYWDPITLDKIRTFNIKNTASNQCRFDVSMDELFFCVGTSNGSVYVYNIDSGKTVTELKYRRSTKAIRTCIFSRDSRYKLSTGQYAIFSK